MELIPPPWLSGMNIQLFLAAAQSPQSLSCLRVSVCLLHLKSALTYYLALFRSQAIIRANGEEPAKQSGSAICS